MFRKIIDQASESYTKMCFDAVLELAKDNGSGEGEAEYEGDKGDAEDPEVAK